jgi:hypothetical protein
MGCFVVPIVDEVFAEEHPTIQFGFSPTKKQILRVIGLINGIVGEPGGMCVAEKWSDEKDENGRYTFLGYCEVNPYLQPEESSE